jgi:hypothetical protein
MVEELHHHSIATKHPSGMWMQFGLGTLMSIAVRMPFIEVIWNTECRAAQRRQEYGFIAASIQVPMATMALLLLSSPAAPIQIPIASRHIERRSTVPAVSSIKAYPTHAR